MVRRARIADRLNQVNKHHQLDDNPRLQPAFPELEGRDSPESQKQDREDLSREAQKFRELWDKFKLSGYVWHSDKLNGLVLQLGHLDRALKKFHDIQVKVVMGQGFKLRNLMRKQERGFTSVDQILKTATEDFLKSLRYTESHLGINS